MNADARERFEAALRDTIALHERAAGQPVPVLEAAAAIVASLRGGGTLLLFGNDVLGAEWFRRTALSLPVLLSQAYPPSR